MNILVDKTLVSYAKPAVFCGHQASKHDTDIKSTFETFDQINPDVYVADADLLNNTVFKNIEERPALKVCVVQKSHNENHPNKKLFEERFGNIYPWIYDNGYADIFDYNNSAVHDRPSLTRQYETDLICIEDGLQSVLENINLGFSIKFRIFSSNLIKSNNYCGVLPPLIKKNMYASSKCSIAVGDNYWNSILCGCYPINLNEDILDQVNRDNTKELQSKREELIEKCTSFHAIANVFEVLNLTMDATIIRKKVKELI